MIFTANGRFMGLLTLFGLRFNSGACRYDVLRTGRASEDELNPPVQGSALYRIVGGDGASFRVTDGSQPSRRHIVFNKVTDRAARSRP
jgi:hypothetical protein